MRTRTFLLAGLAVALLLAGGLSFYASSHPDGLEHVAEQTGFLDTAEDSPTAEAPFADYGTAGVDDARLGGGIAGVVGSLIVLALGGGLFWLLRRRGPHDEALPPEGRDDRDGSERRDATDIEARQPEDASPRSP